MAMTARSRRSTMREGVAALLKSLILLAGVPFALGRLWFESPLPSRLFRAAGLTSLSTWSHASVLFVGGVWVFASANLLRDVAGALRTGGKPGSGWSARWAVAIAALVVGATASPSLLHGSRAASPPAAATSRTHAARDLFPFVSLAHAHALPGECLPDFAERVGRCADDWPAIAALNFGAVQPDGARMLDPAHLRGGWHLRIAPHARRRRPSSPARSSGGGTGLAELALTGLGIVTVCALARRVRVLRRRERAMRREGEFATKPDSEVTSLDATIEPYGQAPLVDWIDAANRLLSRADDAAALDVRLVRAGPDGVEFLLADPVAEACWPFRAERGGRWWRLDPLADLEALNGAAEGLPRRFPALVPLGDDERSSYLIPLGPGRRLGITGVPALVDAAVGAIVTGLRVVPWAEQCAVELIGLQAPPAAEQCYQLRSAHPRSLATFADDAASRLHGKDAAMAQRQAVFVVARHALTEASEALLDKASKIAGLIVAGHGGTAVVHVDEEGAVLHPFAIALEGLLPRPDQLAIVDSLLAAASRSPDIVPIPDVDVHTDSDLESIPPARVVECRVLRAVPDVVGFAQLPYRGDADRVVESLAYLALHGGRVSVEAISEALYLRSRKELRRGRAEKTLSALGACLGDDPSGHPLLVRHGDEISLSDEVSCDWLRAQRALVGAVRAEPHRALDLLRSALALVDGAPCASVSAGFGWVRAEGIAEAIEGALVDGAHQLCGLALAGGDVALARWAVDAARRCAPESELLARDLMVVSDAAGDGAGMRAAFAELEAALDRLGRNEPSAESRALFEALESD